MKLNFTISELTASTVAKRRGINNTPSLKELDNMLELIVNCLQPIRDGLNKPMTVSSGYRNAEVNKLVGGKSNSQHLTGCACDFVVKGMSVDEFYEFIKNGGFFPFFNFLKGFRTILSKNGLYSAYKINQNTNYVLTNFIG